jgi:histidinol-phosphate aminotransferase
MRASVSEHVTAAAGRCAPRLDRRAWLGAALALGSELGRPGLAHAAPVIRLGLNENPFGPSPLAIQAIQSHLARLSSYTAGEADDLVAAIAAREGVKPEQVVLGEVLEALGHLLAQRGGAGGEFLYSNPGYTALIDAAQSERGLGVGVPLDAQLENDLVGLRKRAGVRTRAIFLVNPHNPSGTVSDPAALHAFVQAAARTATVIVDEAYLEFTSDFATRTVAPLVRPDGRVVVFRTFTKFYGLAALPLGYALLPLDLAAALRKLGLGAPRSLNRLALVAARASLEDGGYAERVRRAVALERARWFEVLDALSIRYCRAVGNFVFFEARQPQARLAAGFLERGIDIGRAFPPLDGWTRISIGLPEENARAQSILRELLGR